ncbi:MAG TPA: ParB N-terminal domain-containing protein [Alphaproteobacteria bacterium]|nr:ParB N-terminal domain-containing protein [Alphaproteobacteria bacterium]
MLLLQPVPVRLDEIYVPAKLRATLDGKKVEALAESILASGLQVPIRVRRDKARYVLVAGLHRLEAMRALGEATIPALVVRAAQH